MKFHNPITKTSTEIDNECKTFDRNLQILAGQFQQKFEDKDLYFIRTNANNVSDLRVWKVGINPAILTKYITADFSETKKGQYELGIVVLNNNCQAKGILSHIANGTWRLATEKEVADHQKEHQKVLDDAKAERDRKDPTLANAKMIQAMAEMTQQMAEQQKTIVALLSKQAAAPSKG